MNGVFTQSHGSEGSWRTESLSALVIMIKTLLGVSYDKNEMIGSNT